MYRTVTVPIALRRLVRTFAVHICWDVSWKKVPYTICMWTAKPRSPCTSEQLGDFKAHFQNLWIVCKVLVSSLSLAPKADPGQFSQFASKKVPHHMSDIMHRSVCASAQSDWSWCILLTQSLGHEDLYEARCRENNISMCKKQRSRPACVFMQSGQDLNYSPYTINRVHNYTV